MLPGSCVSTQRLVQTAGTDRSLDPIVFGILLTTGIAIILADTGHFNPGRDEFIRRDVAVVDERLVCPIVVTHRRTHLLVFPSDPVEDLGMANHGSARNGSQPPPMRRQPAWSKVRFGSPATGWRTDDARNLVEVGHGIIAGRRNLRSLPLVAILRKYFSSMRIYISTTQIGRQANAQTLSLSFC